MKRKLLLEFAEWLEKGRTSFDITRATQCVSQHALRFAEQRNLPGQRKDFRSTGSESPDLTNIFDIPARQAGLLFSSGFDWNKGAKITRKVAAKVIRKLARTGTVDFGEFKDPPSTSLWRGIGRR